MFFLKTAEQSDQIWDQGCLDTIGAAKSNNLSSSSNAQLRPVFGQNDKISKI